MTSSWEQFEELIKAEMRKEVMSIKDYYQTLGVMKGASSEDIKKAFRRQWWQE